MALAWPGSAARPLPLRGAAPGRGAPGGGGATMSTAMNFSTKSFQARPPDKGAFPLDHLGECGGAHEAFMRCLRQAGFQSAPCRAQAKAYLQCRMDRQLMAKEPLEKLGFKDLIDEKPEGEHQKLK